MQLRNKERKSPSDSWLKVAFQKKEKIRETIFSKMANPLVEEKFLNILFENILISPNL